MDYGGQERRKTKKDLKRKRLARGYKRGGQFRTQNVDEVGEGVDKDGCASQVPSSRAKVKKSKRKNRKY